MPRHLPSTPPTSRLNAFDPLTLTDGRLDSFEGVVGDRENRGLEKSLSGEVRRQEEGIRGVWEVLDLRTSSNFVSHNLRYVPLIICSETRCMKINDTISKSEITETSVSKFLIELCPWPIMAIKIYIWPMATGLPRFVYLPMP